ncbi:MAG TPA: hydrogenase 4 subunit B [Candidatus Acidoferrales bacterium]|nr:hydrogenase 4 subunit B [Candidatus Acidoferrales bacterium]
MNALPVRETFALGLGAYALGAFACLGSWRKPALARYLCCGLALAAAALEGCAAVLGLLQGTPVRWSISSGVPLFAYSFAYDALAGFFNLILAVLAAAVTIYSFGYLKEFEGKRNIGLFGFLYHILLLSLTIVFAAANAFLFLIAWEVMALTAYGLVSFYYEDPETRRAGLLYIIMSHIDSGFLFLGFLLLIQASGSVEFASFGAAAKQLSSSHQAAAFVLFFLGFSIKAGVIPFHIWLPAAHPVAPSNISALLSGIVIKTGIYGMARIFFDALGVLPAWAGMLVLILGVASAVLGVLYALMEHDLKRLLAYHSIENIGIILMGLGSALIFRVMGHPQLAAVALIAAMFHTLNHAIFKCLLFLGAGSVLHSTGTRNMEKLGGLIRPMPATAFCFLIGAVAISGLPPLNGFVSEWLTYQSLLAGFGATGGLTRILFPIAGSMLALTGALAAACFVKAFAITFLALPRGAESHHVHEAPRSMLIGMGWLTTACVFLGLGATWFLPIFDAMTEQLLGLRVGVNLITGKGLVLSAGTSHGGTVSTAVIGIGLLILMAPTALLASIGARRFGRRQGPTWDCGLPGLSSENEYTATAFSKPLRMIFSALYQPRREIQAVFDVSPYYPKEIHFESEIEPTFEKRLYAPLQDLILRLSIKLRAVQAGSIHAYLAYIFITLILLLLFGVRS